MENVREPSILPDISVQARCTLNTATRRVPSSAIKGWGGLQTGHLSDTSSPDGELDVVYRLEIQTKWPPFILFISARF